MPRLDILGAVLLNGISFAILLFLLAAGLELMFGVMKIVNLAHGAFYMMGAYVAIIVVEHTGSFVLGALAGACSWAAQPAAQTEQQRAQEDPDDAEDDRLQPGVAGVSAHGARAPAKFS